MNAVPLVLARALVLVTALGVGAAAAAAPPAAPPPAMVTLARGPVAIVDGGKSSPAPAAPFLLAAGQALDLGEGAHAVFLRQGGAFTVDGPKRIDPGWLEARAASGPEDAVGTLLERRTSLASVGASRSGGLAVVRPVPGAPALALREVRWRCDACAAMAVTVSDAHGGGVVWKGTGDHAVAYGGPALAPGTYVVSVGATEQSVRIVARTEADAAIAAAHPDAIPDAADRAAAIAGALLLAGFPTDALATLEQAGLTELAAQTERLAGVGP